MIKMINKQKENYLQTHNIIRNEIMKIEANNIKHKLRGDILLKKLTDQTKYMNETNDQIYFSNENSHYLNEKLSYVTVSCIDPENLDTDQEIFYRKQIETTNGIKENQKFFSKKKNRSKSFCLKEKKSIEYDFNNGNQTSKKTSGENFLFLLEESKEESKKQKKLKDHLDQILKEE